MAKSRIVIYIPAYQKTCLDSLSESLHTSRDQLIRRALDRAYFLDLLTVGVRGFKEKEFERFDRLMELVRVKITSDFVAKFGKDDRYMGKVKLWVSIDSDWLEFFRIMESERRRTGDMGFRSRNEYIIEMLDYFVFVQQVVEGSEHMVPFPIPDR